METLYEMAVKLDPVEAMRLANKSKTHEERCFYVYIVNMNLQRKQKEVIEKNLF